MHHVFRMGTTEVLRGTVIICLWRAVTISMLRKAGTFIGRVAGLTPITSNDRGFISLVQRDEVGIRGM